MHLTILVERQDDGRWLAKVPDLPGVQAYAENRSQAVKQAQDLAMRSLVGGSQSDKPAPHLNKPHARFSASSRSERQEVSKL